MKIYIKRKGVFLISATDEDLIKLKKLSENNVYCFDFKLVRNYDFLEKYFVLIKFAWDNLPEQYVDFYKTIQNFRYQIQEIAGFYDLRPTLEGELKKIPRSISFESMEEHEFEQVYKNVKFVLLNSVFRGYDEKILEHIEQYY